MSTPIRLAGLVALLATSFLAGSWFNQHRRPASSAARRILYYRDPMHPAYKSGQPGTAPDCGMALEPVYEGSEYAELSATSVRLSAEQQQIIGLRVERVERSQGGKIIRVPGRVAADETRVYKLNATADGWIREISQAATTGSLVSKGQTLASYYAPEFLGAEQAYLYALSALDRFQATGKETPDQIKLTHANIQQAKDAMQVLGMSELQANEIARNRELTQNIRIVAPAGGFVVARNVSPGQRFEKGTEFFRLADLSRVWILADIFESDAADLRAGSSATVRYRGQTLHARVSNVLPQFDAATRTLKARLEMENPGFVLRPDMFVDIELPLKVVPGLAVPVDAVVHSGMRKTVFVEMADGCFEQRAVETGWRSGDRIQIIAGLQPGERIVTAGNFLLDSESRMRLTAMRSAAAAAVKDPSCGMDINPAAAAERAKVKGQTYYFCSRQCKAKYLGKQHPIQRAGFAHD
jgi:membrane fusion protein, copper/silver efflux system